MRISAGPLPALALAVLCGGLCLEALPSLAQSNMRSVFPGRRIGGGTRGECTARTLAHLVPINSVFAPGSSRLVGLLEGPTANPSPLVLEFRPYDGGSGRTQPTITGRRELPASPAGVTLFTLGSLDTAMVWESSYRCDGGVKPNPADPLQFVEAVSPPAISLLVGDATPADRAVQASLSRLKASCGQQVPRADVATAFGLDDVVTSDWPARLPVRCL